MCACLVNKHFAIFFIRHIKYPIAACDLILPRTTIAIASQSITSSTILVCLTALLRHIITTQQGKRVSVASNCHCNYFSGCYRFNSYAPTSQIGLPLPLPSRGREMPRWSVVGQSKNVALVIPSPLSMAGLPESRAWV